MSLPTSKLYFFTSANNDFSMTFLEGQKLIYDLTLQHNNAASFSFFRDVVLSFQPLIYFLKSHESLGIYIDGEEPFFRFKIESGYEGKTRTLLIPQEAPHIEKITKGIARVIKLSIYNSRPYSSHIEISNNSAVDIVTNVIDQSYQTDAQVFVSKKTDSSLLIHRLPMPQLKNEPLAPNSITSKEFYLKERLFFQKILNLPSVNHSAIIQKIKDHSFNHLYTKEISFFCPCSKLQMIQNIATLSLADKKHIFKEDSAIKVKCDYCKKTYIISKEDVNKTYAN